MFSLYPGTADQYFSEIARERSESDARRRNAEWLRDSDTATVIAELGHVSDFYGRWSDRACTLRTELNNRAHNGDALAMPYKITESE